MLQKIIFIDRLLNNTLTLANAQKVLDFLIWNSGKQFLTNEIERAMGISRVGINLSLRTLVKGRLIFREKS